MGDTDVLVPSSSSSLVKTSRLSKPLGGHDFGALACPAAPDDLRVLRMVSLLKLTTKEVKSVETQEHKPELRSKSNSLLIVPQTSRSLFKESAKMWI